MASQLDERTRPPEAREVPEPAATAGRLRALPPAQRAALAALLVVLTVVPVLFSLARPADHFSEFTVQRLPGGAPLERPLDEYVRYLLARPRIQRPVYDAKEDRPSWALYEPRPEDVTVTAAGPRGLRAVVRVPGRTGREAQDVAVVFARGIEAEGAGAARAARNGRARVREIDAMLREPGLTRARRAELTEERRFITVGRGAIVPLEVSEPPARRERTGVERLIAAVDRTGAPRPHPVWAGLVGLLLGLAVGWAWLRLRARGT